MTTPPINENALPNAASGHSVFATTHWSVVLKAGSDSPAAQDALAVLCRTYWQPLYAYARRRGHSPADAQDLTQEFFVSFMRRNAFGAASPGKGKFRSFLLASMSHFLADEWDKSRAQKRGGGQIIILDSDAAENALQSMETLSPEELYDKQWALTLLEEVYLQLQSEYRKENKAALFDALRFSLMGERSAVPYEELANRLGLSEGAVKVAVHRLRKRYRHCLREKIAMTVTTPDEVEEELRFLVQALGKG